MTDILVSFADALSADASLFLAFLSGLVTSITPCSLSQLPLILAYVGKEASPSKAFRLSLVYALGSSLMFTALGIAAALLGSLFGNASPVYLGILGVLMVLMALQIWDVVQIIPSSFLTGRNSRRGYIGAFIAGLLAGLFSSPCSTPVLVVLLTLAAAEGEAIRGGLLLFAYAAGVSMLAIILGSSPSLIRGLARNDKLRAVAKVLNILLGAIVLAMGLYLLYLAF